MTKRNFIPQQMQRYHTPKQALRAMRSGNIGAIWQKRLPEETLRELERTLAKCAGYVKMMCGVSVNCAVTITKNAFDRISDLRSEEDYERDPWHPHPGYKGYAKSLFKQFDRELYTYFSSLLVPPLGEPRFFEIGDLPEKSRNIYKTHSITNREYFEFWRATGVLPFQKSRPLIGSLHNKFRLSLQSHGVPCPELTAWALVGASVLELAQETWQRAMRSVHEACDGLLTVEEVETVYRLFSPQRMSQAWQAAIKVLSPEADAYKLGELETRNIALGLNQLRELWISANMPFDATIAAVEDYSEDIFASRGQAKRAIRELMEMREDAIRDLEEQRKNCPSE